MQVTKQVGDKIDEENKNLILLILTGFLIFRVGALLIPAEPANLPLIIPIGLEAAGVALDIHYPAWNLFTRQGTDGF